MYARYVKLRNARGLRDTDVAKALNIPQATFSEWKRGKSVPKVPKLLKIADFFGITLDELVRGHA